jgi:hypothetical protein
MPQVIRTAKKYTLRFATGVRSLPWRLIIYKLSRKRQLVKVPKNANITNVCSFCGKSTTERRFGRSEHAECARVSNLLHAEQARKQLKKDGWKGANVES